MPVTSPGLIVALARCARRFHQVAGAGHHVASPLGAWLLLALAGPACAGEDLRQLEEILGADADTAAGFAAELLACPHPLVHAGAAMWGGTGSADDRIASWQDKLPPQVATGPVHPGRFRSRGGHRPRYHAERGYPEAGSAAHCPTALRPPVRSGRGGRRRASKQPPPGAAQPLARAGSVLVLAPAHAGRHETPSA